ncbi:uncharacterized protein SCHCODRAFT_02608408 [Schizophyllum commune H4-8]|uniref:uncharacterized protein n=1 Tax=Schizophyllum commune (strain H4-8 / FGSC 9210) TaxID=578458 RepID=UPI00215F1A02|nr:uncharacterized protein SCHCODRAFT_02608408 [Schizophyllum commune H4-8]KAI5900631.1 hypothetical protein SCHCODRAFT_02608408 [Schizophyllum commune H4-8]
MEGAQNLASGSRLRGGGYNITLGSITSSLLSVPSRMLARMRRADEILHKEAMAKRAAAAAAEAAAKRASTAGGGPPGLRWWGFFTSGYMLGIIIVAVLVHRIQNVVVPSRVQPVYRRRNQGIVQRVYNSFLPIDLDKATTRFALHSVSLYLILRMLVIWGVVVLQTSQLYPEEPHTAWIQRLGEYVVHLPMGRICWDTFVAICAVTCAQAFTRGLDGLGNTLLTSHGPSSPINLVSYAFMLHIYSSPLAHTFHPSGLPSRPDKHVCIALTLPVIQIAMQHIISIRKRWATHRFWPSAIRSLLSLAHFWLTIISYTRYIEYVPYLPQIVAQSNRNVPGHAGFPQVQLMPNVFESFMIFTTVLTIALNTVTQLLLTGRVDKPLLGLGLSTGDGRSIYIPYDEDFTFFLSRVGTASLEATGLRGWGNEVGAVNALATPPRHQGLIQLSGSGVIRVVPGTSKTGKPLKGLHNEVQDVDLGATPQSGFFTNLASLPLVDWGWMWALWGFGKAVVGAGRGLLAFVWAAMKGDTRVLSWKRPVLRGPDIPAVRRPEEEEGAEDQEDELYRRFLVGDSLSDADDDEPAQWESDEAGDEDTTDGSDGEESEPDAEALALFMDLQRSRARSRTPTPEASSSSAAPLFMAHMVREGSSPLTRRQYLALTTGKAGGGEVEQARARSSMSTDDDEVRRMCVICTCELREIICWPCRCLSMCNSCRESLAAQSGSSKHRCPCCRRKVEGYSKIFIP